jgi:DNA mismatch repair protein MutL
VENLHTTFTNEQIQNINTQNNSFTPFETDSPPLAYPISSSSQWGPRLEQSENWGEKGAKTNSEVITQLNLQTQSNTHASLNVSPEPTTPYRLIGQYNTTYILVEKEDGLFLVDQHAAHERILYELFSQRFEEVATVQLLFPHIITLSSQDIAIITPHLDIFTDNGIIIEQCASNQLKIESLPVHLKDQSLDDIIQTTVAWITESSTLDQQELKKMVNNKLQAQMACKAAVKAGDTLTQEKMEQLLRDLEKTANRFSCPHGRPTGWLLSLHEIEKKFKRRI